MANFEYDYNNNDYELVASQVVGQLTNDDYVRIIIYDSQLNTIITFFVEIDRFLFKNKY